MPQSYYFRLKFYVYNMLQLDLSNVTRGVASCRDPSLHQLDRNNLLWTG